MAEVYALAGLLLGWVVRDFLGKKKLDPNILRAANEQIGQVRIDLGGQLSLERDAREKDRRAFSDLLTQYAARVDYWVNRADTGRVRESSGHREEVPPSPPRPAPEDIEKEYRMAVDGSTKEDPRQALLDKGLTAAESDAILNGEYGDLPSGDRLDLFVQESVRDSTGLL